MQNWHRRQRARLATFATAAVLTAAVACPASSMAQVDLNGLWRVGVFVTDLSLTFADVCSITVVQSGMTLSFSGPCEGAANPVNLSGSIDPDTGSFTGSGSAGACPSVTVSGIAARNSKSFTGTFSCPEVGASGGVNAGRCGNGQVDPGEICDDGNLFDDDCCQSNCRPPVAGGSCADDGNSCTSDTCDAAGQCQHLNRSGTCDDGNACTPDDACVGGQCIGTVPPDGTPCDDGNACTTGDHCVGGTCVVDPVVCPSCEACTGTQGCVPTISTGCKEAPASAILLRRLNANAMVWKWQRGDATSRADFGSPPTTTDYDFCVYDGHLDAAGAPNLVVSTRAPAGSNWYATTNGFGYISADHTPDGLQRVRLQSGAVGKSRLLVRGSGFNLSLPPLQSITMPLTVQLKSRDRADSQCWSAVYNRAAISNPLLLRSQRATRLPQTRPNIVIINLDDIRADGIDRMPTLAQLASQGISFTNSFAGNPLCAPSRASLLTGLHGVSNGVRALGGPLGGAALFRQGGRDRQTIATWLQGAGYTTGFFGKYINGYGIPAERSQGPDGTFYVPPGWTRWRGMTSPEHFGGVRGSSYTLVDEHGVPTLYDDHSNDGQYSTDVLAAQLRAFVADAVDQNRPFFAMWAPYAGHAELPGYVPSSADRHFHFFRTLLPWRPASFDEADVADKPRFIQQLPLGSLNAVILNDAIRIGAYETLLSVDEQLHVLLDDLVRLGIDQNTVILVTSDNGVGWGEHRLYSQAKECPYEECVRVPMIVRDPRVDAAAVYDAAVLTIDVAPTVAELAGVVPPVPTDGMSFAPWIAGSPPPQWRDNFLIQHWRSVRDDALRYTGQVSDGDQVRILYGDTRRQPRASTLFEFDADAQVADDAVPVPIEASADETFDRLRTAIAAHVPNATPVHQPANDRLAILDRSPDHAGVYVLVKRDQGSVIDHPYPVADWFGVRDVARALTYVEHESGEVELYDLRADPWQLENKAADPAYATTREGLALRLADLLR